MDKEANQEPPPPNQQHPSLLLPTTTTTTTTTIKEFSEDSPKKPFTAAATTNDRLKRDEWSEGAVSSLLEAYESKWVLRNRAKLKGHDWEDVARHVSSRANNTKSPKTQTQCKNKIESMKKRYRSESANADGSSWLLYPRLDLLLRGTNSAAATAAAPPPPLVQQYHHHENHLVPPANSGPLMLMEPSPVAVVQPPPPPAAPPPLAATGQNSHGSNGVDRMAKEDDGGGTKVSEHAVSEKREMETDSSTPALYSEQQQQHEKEKVVRSKKLKMKMEKNNKRRKREEWEIAESIRWLAEVMVRSEQARMETMREIEKMRVEAEAKRGEIDLKRTEIIANTQLEIAKLFASSSSAKSVDSSLRIGRS